MARPKIYSIEALDQLLTDYKNANPYETTIVWKKVVEWIRQHHPQKETYRNISISHFSRFPELQVSRRIHNINVPKTQIDSDRADAIIQDLSFDARDFGEVSQTAILKTVSAKNQKIQKLVDSFIECQNQNRNLRRERTKYKNACEKYKETIATQETEIADLKKERRILREENRRLVEENRDVLKTNAQINSCIALDRHQNNGYCYYSDANRQIDSDSEIVSRAILTESEARVMELMKEGSTLEEKN